jgi:hypothetical protein
VKKINFVKKASSSLDSYKRSSGHRMIVVNIEIHRKPNKESHLAWCNREVATMIGIFIKITK